jgi:hypothetical protein
MKPQTLLIPAAVAEAAKAIGDGPVFMLNLLRFRDQAHYGAESQLPPCTGREAYFERYAPAFRKIGGPLGVRLFWAGRMLAPLVAGDGESWDDVAVVEYPHFGAFQEATQCAQYAAEAAPHRLAALRDWRLIATRKQFPA